MSIGEFTPKSLKSVTKLVVIHAIATMPYLGGDRSLAMIMTSTADMIVEVARSQKRSNAPLAETLAILIALVTKVFS